ncbi:MAG TPA: hypothetical protein VLE93_02020 [Candidatus Saccharimonadales bacterium]|nr:hypothetical protein [Candidatus Saccharimonadales bacterium]
MHYCAYSFADLFQAAHGKGLTKKEGQAFAALSQNHRNQKVRELAKLANWQTKDVKSLEGPIFTAFWPVKS